jgi:hypothetical protein
LSDGKRNEIRGAPGGRTRYPMTMRKIRLDPAIATRARIKSCGNIVEYYNLKSEIEDEDPNFGV